MSHNISTWAFIGTVLIGGIAFLGYVLCSCMGSDGEGAVGAFLANRACWIVFGTIITFMVSSIKEVTDHNSAALEALSEVKWECTDEYSRVNTELLS